MSRSRSGSLPTVLLLVAGTALGLGASIFLDALNVLLFFWRIFSGGRD